MVHMGKRGFLMNCDQVIEHAKEVAKELNITDHRAHPSVHEVYLIKSKIGVKDSLIYFEG